MDNPRPEKVAVVEEVRERFDAASAAILTEYRGLSVKDMAVLRRSLTTAGGTYKVYKNTLVGFAARDLGLTELEPMLTGPTAIAFVQGDAVDVAKTLRDFARTHPSLVVKGGLLGKRVLSSADAAALADVAPREVLLARFAGAMAAPMVQFAGLLQALPRNLAYGLKALIDLRGGVDDAESAEPAAAEAPVTEEPAAEAPPAEEPAAQAPAAAEAPAAEAPAAEARPAEAPPAEAPAAADEPAAEAPPAEAPAEEPTAQAPAAAAAPAAGEPADEPEAPASDAASPPAPDEGAAEIPSDPDASADPAAPTAATEEGASGDTPPADSPATTEPA